MTKNSKDKFETIVGVGSILIVALLLGYWGYQIDGVLEMLELAYG